MVDSSSYYDESSGRTIIFLTLGALSEWPVKTIAPPAFALFVACDLRSVEGDEMARFARSSLGKGAKYVAVWGPNAKALHDAFDAEAHREPAQRAGDAYDLMTIWNEEETLDEALWFFIDASQLPAGVEASVIVVIGEVTWAKHVRGRLSDLNGLRSDVLG